MTHALCRRRYSAKFQISTDEMKHIQVEQQQIQQAHAIIIDIETQTLSKEASWKFNF